MSQLHSKISSKCISQRYHIQKQNNLINSKKLQEFISGNNSKNTFLKIRFICMNLNSVREFIFITFSKAVIKYFWFFSIARLNIPFQHLVFLCIVTLKYFLKDIWHIKTAWITYYFRSVSHQRLYLWKRKHSFKVTFILEFPRSATPKFDFIFNIFLFNLNSKISFMFKCYYLINIYVKLKLFLI